MGNCFSIEIEPWNKDQIEQQIDVHRSLTDDGDNTKSKTSKTKCISQSSDEETSQSDGGATAANKVLRSQSMDADPNVGKAQSPLDFITVQNLSSPLAYQAMDAAEQSAYPLKFNYPDLLRGCSIVNTGYTVQVNIAEHTKCNVAVNKQSYHLRQFHFKTPSEHTIDGKRYEMEMQLVHENENKEVAIVSFLFSTKQRYDKPTMKLRQTRKSMVKQTKSIVMKYMKEKANTNESDDDDPLHQAAQADMAQDVEEEVDSDASDAEFITRGGNPRKESRSMVPSNDFLKQFWSELPIQQTAKDAVLSKAISFDYLFECASKNFKPALENNEIGIDMKFFEYDGSLTTPPFTEGVKWMVSKKINYVSDKQMNKLRSCWGHGHNSRGTHEYNGRVVKLRSECCLRGYFFS